jgi:hypothetical protein
MFEYTLANNSIKYFQPYGGESQYDLHAEFVTDFCDWKR